MHAVTKRGKGHDIASISLDSSQCPKLTLVLIRNIEYEIKRILIALLIESLFNVDYFAICQVKVIPCIVVYTLVAYDNFKNSIQQKD